MSALAFACDDYRSPTVNGAAIFTDTTAYTQMLHHIRLPYADTFSFVVFHLALTEFDSLVWSGAMLLANNAGCSGGIGQTEVFVEMGPADDGSVFFVFGQSPDGAARANLAAERTVVFTIPNATDEPGSKDPLQARLKPRGVKGVADADLHTFATAYAKTEKL
jgi:hypothetical protein